MKLTSLELHSKPSTIPELPPVIISEEHWYIGSIANDQALPGTIHESYSDAAFGSTGSKYVSTAQDEGILVGQSFAHFTAPPASPYEIDTWEVFETFIDFDTSGVDAEPLSVKLRLYINLNQISIAQNLLVAIHDWGGGGIAGTDWLTPDDLSALSPIGNFFINSTITDPYIELDIDPSVIVIGGHTRVVLYTSELRDLSSPGGPGPSGFTHSVIDTMEFGTVLTTTPGPELSLRGSTAIGPDIDSVVLLSFRDPLATNPYNALAVDGLDTDLIVPNYYATDSGSKFYNLVRKARNIVIQAGLNPNFQDLESYSDLRDALYRLISASRTGEIQLRFKNGSEVVAAINGFVSKLETDLFERAQEAKLTLECKDPMLKSLAPVNLDFDISDPTTLILQDDKSTAPHGFSFIAEFNAEVDVLNISNEEDGFSFIVRPQDPFTVNDRLHFSSDFKNKYLYLVRDGGVTQLGDVIDLRPIWPLIFPGTNVYHVNAGASIFWQSISHYETYWGV